MHKPLWYQRLFLNINRCWTVNCLLFADLKRLVADLYSFENKARLWFWDRKKHHFLVSRHWFDYHYHPLVLSLNSVIFCYWKWKCKYAKMKNNILVSENKHCNKKSWKRKLNQNKKIERIKLKKKLKNAKRKCNSFISKM